MNRRRRYLVLYKGEPTRSVPSIGRLFGSVTAPPYSDLRHFGNDAATLFKTASAARRAVARELEYAVSLQQNEWAKLENYVIVPVNREVHG